jgi:hypothetical protein
MTSTCRSFWAATMLTRGSVATGATGAALVLLFFVAALFAGRARTKRPDLPAPRTSEPPRHRGARRVTPYAVRRVRSWTRLSSIRTFSPTSRAVTRHERILLATARSLETPRRSPEVRRRSPRRRGRATVRPPPPPPRGSRTSPRASRSATLDAAGTRAGPAPARWRASTRPRASTATPGTDIRPPTWAAEP